MEAYYFSHMDKQKQAAYHAIKTGLIAMEPSFRVPLTDGRELQDIFFKLRLDEPEIFYAVGFQYRFYKDADSVEMIPEYLFPKKKIKEHQKAMAARLQKLVRPAEGMKEIDKELYIHDFICQNVRYDKLKKPYSHEIIGPLGQGVGVCEGIAKTVKVLCDRLGIWCVIAISEANPDKQIKYRHAWNLVKINKKYYQLDVTFDNSLGFPDSLRYDYFNLDDKRFYRDHEPAMYAVPPCDDGDHFYYREKKLSFTKLEDVAGRTSQAIRKGKPLVFHWRGGHLNQQTLTDILETLAGTAAPKQKQLKISLNRSQGVFYVTFADLISDQQMVVENALDSANGFISL